MTPQEIEALRVEALKDKVEALSDMVEILKAERDALAAQVDLLKDSINKCTIDNVALLRLSPELKQIVAATPQQCLRDVQAEAVLCAVSVCEFTQQIVVDSDSTSYPTVAVCLSEDLIQCAESVR